MQVLLMMWLLLAGMKAGLWEAIEASAPAGTTEADVTAAEGPINPPPKP